MFEGVKAALAIEVGQLFWLTPQAAVEENVAPGIALRNVRGFELATRNTVVVLDKVYKRT